MRKNKSIEIVTSAYIFELAEQYSRIEIYNFDAHLNQLIKRRKSDLVLMMLQKQHTALIQDENNIENSI